MKKFYLILTFCLSTVTVGFGQVYTIAALLSRPSSIAIDGDNLYFAQENSDYIMRVDLTEPYIPTPYQVVQLGALGSAKGLNIVGDYLYYAEYGQLGLLRINLTTTNPIVETVFSTGSDTIHDILIEGDDVYFFTQNNLEHVSLLNPSFTRTIIIANTGAASGLSKENNLLFYITTSQTTVKQVDLSTNTETDAITGLTMAKDTKWVNGTFFITEGFNGNIGIISGSTAIPTIMNDTLVTVGGLLDDMTVQGSNIYASVISNGTIVKFSIFLTTTENIKQTSWTIFPNPSQEFIQIKGLQTSRYFMIFDRKGRLVQQGQTQPNDMIPISLLPNGVYYISLDNGEIQQFIKR